MPSRKIAAERRSRPLVLLSGVWAPLRIPVPGPRMHDSRGVRGEAKSGGEMHPIDWITGSIIDSAMRIHSALGPGLFESVYEVVLERDLVRAGFHVERQKAIGFGFEGFHFEPAAPRFPACPA